MASFNPRVDQMYGLKTDDNQLFLPQAYGK